MGPGDRVCPLKSLAFSTHREIKCTTIGVNQRSFLPTVPRHRAPSSRALPSSTSTLAAAPARHGHIGRTTPPFRLLLHAYSPPPTGSPVERGVERPLGDHEGSTDSLGARFLPSTTGKVDGMNEEEEATAGLLRLGGGVGGSGKKGKQVRLGRGPVMVLGGAGVTCGAFSCAAEEGIEEE